MMIIWAAKGKAWELHREEGHGGDMGNEEEGTWGGAMRRR